MKWFKKSLPANHESHHNPKYHQQQQQQHKRIKKTNLHLKKSNSLPATSCSTVNLDVKIQRSLSLLACHNIEIIDPDIFFQDPEHVRNYKEEEIFLKIMSEWEIVEHPSASVANYFSADFEEEFLQMKTQQTEAVETAANDECPNELTDKGCTTKSARKRTYKRSLTELFFADKIEIGLFPPMKSTSSSTTSSNCSSPSFSKKRRRLKTSATRVEDDDCTTQYPSTCSKRIFKDCAIDRSQLKTEALACSIMGAIGKCPAKDKTPRTSINDLIIQTGDSCHPVNICDHYDIKQFFRLDDNGNILLNTNHVKETKGIGLAARENTKVYKRFLKKGCTAEEHSFCDGICCMEILKRLLTLLWDKIKCEFIV